MAKLEFDDLRFEEDNDLIKVTFLKIFYFNLSKQDIKEIDDFKIEKNAIIFKNISEKKATNKFYRLLEKGFKDLKNKLNNKKTIYIHKNSGIPLIGHVAFGLVDRNTNLIEVKPITSCNINCIYCSVDEDKRPTDFVIEEEYLAEEFRKLVEFKDVDGIDAHIASQGEPLLYSPLVDLVKDISKINQVKNISIDTNGTMLNKQLVDELVDAGLTQFNLSINALDVELSKKIANGPYDIENIKELAKYISKKANLIITPVMLHGVNEEEMPKIIKFAKEINAKMGIQNFLNYRFGRNPVKQINFDKFYEKLKAWEKEFDIKLILDESYFNIKKTKQLDKPFDKEDVVKAQIIGNGRLKNEKIAVAKDTSEGRFRKDKVFSKRIITIPNCDKQGNVKIRITKSKHNIFIGELV